MKLYLYFCACHGHQKDGKEEKDKDIEDYKEENRTAEEVVGQLEAAKKETDTENLMLKMRIQDVQNEVKKEGKMQSKRAKSVADDSQGTFDPGLGALVQLWGFDDPEHFRETPPPDAELAAALQRPHRLARAQLTADRLEVGAPGLMLDFGAMAKGAAVGAALQQLRDAGIEHAMVNAGGDLQVIGHAESCPWRIAVRHPRPPEEAPRLLVALELEDGESVFTSGDYERYFEHAGRRYHHVLDPRSGEPSTGAQSSTVVHGDPALADALATALFVGGPDQFHALVDEFALKYAMLVDADGRIHATPGFRHRAQWLTDVQFAPDPVAP